MTYQHQDLNSRQAQKIFGIAPYVGQYTQYGAQTSAINGFGAYSEGVYQPHGQSDPGRDPVSAAFKHRQAIPQQTAQERAYAVSIPAQPTTSDPVNGHYSKPIASQPASSTLPIDYQLLLLSLSDEYLAAAYGHGAMADITRREVEMEDYHKLIATGLGCLEALLKHFRLSPEREAVVRLRYATVLYEETENTIEAEESLSKGIIICDRHRFFDLKYDMQHLLARILFEKNQRAAFKYLDNMINDAEAYQHIAWVYVFRFLRVFLHLELSSHQDLVAALNQLRSIIYMSNDYGDKTVLAVAKALEALTYLRNPTDAEYVEQAQRALAGVRSLQLDPAIGELHQLAVLTSFVDLCCHLQRFEPQQANMKLQVMRNALSTVDTGPSWTDDGTFAIPIPKARMPSCKSSSGVIREQHDANSLVLMFSWMPKQDIYNVGYLLSGVTMAHRNTTDGQKSEHMFEQGIQRLEWAQRENSKVPRSVALASDQQTWREQMTCYMRLYLAFILCARTSWSAAREQQSKIERIVTYMGKVPETLLLLTVYLDAVLHQGTGDLAKALSRYQSPILSLPPPSSPSPGSLFAHDIRILSALNAVLIIRSPFHPQHHIVEALLKDLEHVCLTNQNRQIHAAYYLVTATTSSSSTILHTKQCLQAALQASKQTEDKHLMCMILNFMSWKFFRGVVGEQAEKSARASQMMAGHCMNGLWISVSAGLLGDTLEAAGRMEDAEKARQGGYKMSGSLPHAVQEVMKRGYDVAIRDEREMADGV